jgi:hypothetical protein
MSDRQKLQVKFLSVNADGVIAIAAALLIILAVLVAFRL